MADYEIEFVRQIVQGFDPERGVIIDDHAVLCGTLIETGAKVSGKIGWPKWKISVSEDIARG
ncbi:hypothetical protein [Burkholderia ubonensis]|uniref:hypothetical protein n=1 Tax=Burkholderia ubonensis TaxID=101571 RepID=UPI0012FBF1F6|nr:hypothetical protein [Burkholderia ubonensis]